MPSPMPSERPAGGGAELRLYQFPISHFCEKTRWALEYKGLRYRARNLLPGFHVKPVRRIAPRTELPVLADGDTVVQGSAAIVDYLDANWPEHPLTPADAGLAAQAREWERLADEDIGPAVRRICYDVLLGHPRLVLPLLTEGCAWYGRVLLPLIFPRLRARMRALLKIHPAGVAASVATLDAALERVNARWAETGYLVGDRFTRADLAVAALLAPLFMPSVYGVPWPRALPADLAELLERYREPVRRAARLYARHRLLVAPDPD